MLDILYEDDDIIAITKPAGLVVHPDIRHKDGTIVQELLLEYPELAGIGENPERPGIVHRLDKDTSGVLLVARNQESYKYLKGLFQEGKMQKKYIALVVGTPRQDEGVINEPIARSTKHFEKRVVGGGQGRAREAITHYKVIERLGDYSLLEVSPKTGRTHQIRSHMAHIGCPVACDELYGGKRFMCPLGLSRQFLHAFSVDFVGRAGTRLHIESPLSADLASALALLKGER